jgi:mono/diheme cytochrome c family protein
VSGLSSNRPPAGARAERLMAERFLQVARVFGVVCLITVVAALLFGQPNTAVQGTGTAVTGDSSPTGNTQNGKRIFASQNCNKCHGSEGQGGSAPVPGPRIGPPRMSLPMFIDFVRQPMSPMPPYSSKAVSDAELADLYAYLKAIPPPLEEGTAPSGNAQNGKQLYASDGCYECHDRDGQGGPATGPRLAPNSIPFAAFARQVRHPADQMPPYTSKVLSDAELADIYAFLQSIPKPPKVENIPLLQ